MARRTRIPIDPVRPGRAARAAIAAAALGVLCCGASVAQIAPGPLSRAHADLNGVTRCVSCHDFGARRLKCLDCHLEIRRRLEAGVGFHPRAYRRSPEATDCARCHPEHRGPAFKFVPLDRKDFDHGVRTGFVLEGKHRALACEKCHNAARLSASARSEIRMKDPDQTFLGLRRECTLCHQEPHRNQLGTECLGCHTPQAWKPASKFDHSRASFRLIGQHQKVACGKCHLKAPSAGLGEAPGGKAAGDSQPGPKEVLFKGLSNGGCRSCHEDRHHGSFQAVKIDGKCEGCHSPDGWKSNHPEMHFNHSLAKFRLVGKHAGLACEKCHKECNFALPIKHDLCRDCHHDRHNGQFAARAAGSDCSACHSPTGFKPPLFDRTAHMSSGFALAGKHLTLSCGKCHPSEGRETRFRTGKVLCPQCHTEPHGGQFASEPYENRCDMCHTTAGFELTTFSRERHAQTRFPLTGRHATVDCDKCHKPLSPTVANSSSEAARVMPVAFSPSGAPKAAQSPPRRFRFASGACDTCHADPHGLSPEAGLPCATCHTTKGWNDPLPFDHSRTRFRLEGRHRDAEHPIPCARCHKPSVRIVTGDGKTVPAFARSPVECSRCHSAKDAHDGQFSSSGEGRRDCSSCHTTAGWGAGGFNHDTTGFALNSAHRTAPCAKCHKGAREVNGRIIRAYRNTPRDCLKCH